MSSSSSRQTPLVASIYEDALTCSAAIRLLKLAGRLVVCRCFRTVVCRREVGRLLLLLLLCLCRCSPQARLSSLPLTWELAHTCISAAPVQPARLQQRGLVDLDLSGAPSRARAGARRVPGPGAHGETKFRGAWSKEEDERLIASCAALAAGPRCRGRCRMAGSKRRLLWCCLLLLTAYCLLLRGATA
jgi:hypothetical protein